MRYNIGAFAYRLMCSFTRCGYLIKMIIFIIVPIFFAYTTTLVPRKHEKTNNTNELKVNSPLPVEAHFATIGKWIQKSQPIVVVSPNTTDVKKLMGALRYHTLMKRPVYLQSANDVSKYVTEWYKKPEDERMDKEICCVNFERLTREKLNYEIRTAGLTTDPGLTSFPSPTSNEKKLIESEYSLFIGLEMAINEAYIREYQPDLASDHANLKFQDLPFSSDYEIYSNGQDLKPANMIIWFTIIFILATFASQIIHEKASGVREILKINGAQIWMIYGNWFIPFGLITMVMAITITYLWTLDIRDGPFITNIEAYICFLVLLIFYWSDLCSVAFIASLISSPICGILVVIGYWAVSYGVIFYLFLAYEMNNTQLIFVSLLPVGGLQECFEAMSAYETVGTRLSFASLLTVPPGSKNVQPLGLTLIIMTISMVIYLAIMLYVDRIKPGPYGRAEPWHFFLPTKKIVAFAKGLKPGRPNIVTEETETEAESRAGKDRRFHFSFFSKPDSKEISNQTVLIEPINEGAKIGLKAEKLVKMFGNFKALNLSITILQNEITVLLGHNGAGKTTFFSIMCGMFSPTSGHVSTENYNVFDRKNIKLFRRELGYCPQFDLLLDNMTVQQHLIFFGMLRGLKYSEAKTESDQWTTQFKIYDRRHNVPKKLSGGMKRKLCLSIAMVGKPKFLLLDEPTSGLDPESRRDIWNVLLGARGSTTTVITTHFMEEADVLGDHVALMVNGKLKCYGTTMFLKQHYGVGYLLNCTLHDRDADQILAMVRGYVPTAKLERKTDKTCLISLPAYEQKKFPSLLLAIGKQADVTVSYSSMDDVFIRVQEDEGVFTTVTDMPKEDENEGSKRAFNLHLQQIALLVKRLKWWYHDWKFYIFLMIILPVASCYLAIYTSNFFYITPPTKKEGFLNLTLDTYAGKRGFVAKKQVDDSVATFIESALTSNGLSYKNIPPGEDTIDFITSLASKDIEDYAGNVIFAFDTREVNPKALISTFAIHSLPIAYGVLVNALMYDVKSTITTISYPFNDIEKGRCRKHAIHPSPVIILLPWFIFFIVMSIAASYFIQFPHKERTTGFKHLQLMTGVWPLFYWLPILVVDFFIVLLLTALVMLTIVSSDTYNLFDSQLGHIALGLILFGISSILMAYVFSFFFKKYTTGVLIYIFLSLFALVASFLLSQQWPKWWKLEYVYFLPWTAFFVYLYNVSEWSNKESICKLCPEDPGLPKCEEIVKTDEINKEINYFLYDMLIYAILILLMEYRIGRLIVALVKKIMYGPIQPNDGTCDLDVVVEKERIKNIKTKSNGNKEEAPIFICDSLGKKYSRGRTAVYDVTFGVQQGECFGLLGTNGAGKSTTFAMLAGLIIPTKGTAEIMGKKLRLICNSGYLKNLGYCPQQEGLMFTLSAKSLITIFGLLRGVPFSQIKTLTKKWIVALDMSGICDRPCGSYSGGNKRKLSLAIAMIGNPSIILLDEPTTGVDPVNRRRIWEILRHSLETNKQTIILTSHSMDECEALCGRITIMVKGVMKCIGPIPRLKKNYGKGCVLQVRLRATSSNTDINTARIKIESKFSPYISLQDEQPGLLNYYINTETIKIHEAFEIMLGIKSANKTIEDFNLSDLTLEQVFLSFTAEQRGQEALPKVSTARPSSSSHLPSSETNPSEKGEFERNKQVPEYTDLFHHVGS